jgi:hypothetical protein
MGRIKKTMPPAILRCPGNVFTELLPSNDRGIFTEPLPTNDKDIFTEPLPSNDTGIFSKPLPSKDKGTLTSSCVVTIGGIHGHTHTDSNVI